MKQRLCAKYDREIKIMGRSGYAKSFPTQQLASKRVPLPVRLQHESVKRDNKVPQQITQIGLPSHAGHAKCTQLSLNKCSSQTIASLLSKIRKDTQVLPTNCEAESLNEELTENMDAGQALNTNVVHNPVSVDINDSRASRKQTIRCPICFETFQHMTDLTDHLQCRHEVQTTVQTLNFDNMHLFREWKQGMETDTQSFFRLRRTTNRKLCHTTYFSCNRNGLYERSETGPRKRAMKVRGYRKTGHSCPARIVLKKSVQQLRPLEVQFFGTHVGHEQDVGHLGLPQNTKQSSAGQLLQGVPPKKVIENVMKTFSPTKRLSYLTTTDLKNIRASFNPRHKAAATLDSSGVVGDSNTDGNRGDLHISLPDSPDDLEHHIISRKFGVEKILNGDVNKSFAERQKDLMDKISACIQSCSSCDELDVIARNFAPVGPALDILRTSSVPSMLPVTAKVPHNKKDQQQRRLQSLKKRKDRRKPLNNVEISQTSHNQVVLGALCPTVSTPFIEQGNRMVDKPCTLVSTEDDQTPGISATNRSRPPILAHFEASMLPAVVSPANLFTPVEQNATTISQIKISTRPLLQRRMKIIYFFPKRSLRVPEVGSKTEK